MRQIVEDCIAEVDQWVSKNPTSSKMYPPKWFLDFKRELMSLADLKPGTPMLENRLKFITHLQVDSGPLEKDFCPSLVKLTRLARGVR